MLGYSCQFLSITFVIIFAKVSISQQCTCTLATWGPWTTCSKSCGGGTQNRRARIWNDNRYCNGRLSPGSVCCICTEGNTHTLLGVCSGEAHFEVSNNHVTASRPVQRRGCNTICYNGGYFRHNYYYYSQTPGLCVCPKGTSGTCCENTISCGRPGEIAHGSFTGSTFTFNHQVQYQCNNKFNMTDSSRATRTCTEQGYWTGKTPECIYSAFCESNPCQNGALCLDLLGHYQCQCQNGWTGKDCEVDVQPPVVSGCPQNRTIITTELISHQTWEVPNITDPHGLDIKISKNYQNNSFEFPWGKFTVQYHAVKPSNGLTAECSFTIAIKPYACKKMRPPVNGSVVCNNWKTDQANVCIFVCKSNYTLPLEFASDDIYVCGSMGYWLPSNPVTDCIIDEFLPWTNYHNGGKLFSTCITDEAAKEIGEYYIEKLKKSAFNSLCVDYPVYCKPENVSIEC